MDLVIRTSKITFKARFNVQNQFQSSFKASKPVSDVQKHFQASKSLSKHKKSSSMYFRGAFNFLFTFFHRADRTNRNYTLPILQASLVKQNSPVFILYAAKFALTHASQASHAYFFVQFNQIFVITIFSMRTPSISFILKRNPFHSCTSPTFGIYPKHEVTNPPIV